ncbi:unnamed protein product [Urochloa decumbens]|uniref:F-box domain-containing protein n=1 Tax=Urochloa decumbens TaxID=240449 RepID=A0ABC9D7V0_9POAL
MAKRRGKKKAGAGRSSRKEKAAATTAKPLPAPIFPAPLPNHLIEGIFVRLRPKTLAASRCVSPSWNRFISSSAFARLYHDAKAAAATSGPVRFVHRVPQGVLRRRHAVTRNMVLAGKLCRGEFFVCNPSTDGALRLPPRCPPWYFYSAGLGYDAAAGKHKAVLLEVAMARGMPSAAPRSWDDDRKIRALRCSVFTVGNPAWRWRAPRGDGSSQIVFEGTLVSPAAHLHVHTRVMDPVVYSRLRDILAFVLGGEFFRRIPLPDFADGGKGKFLLHETLAELGGRLGLVRDLRCRKRAIEIWILHDAMSGSWSLDRRPLDRRIDMRAHLREKLWAPSEVFVLCYVGGESAGSRCKKILLATNVQTVYVYDPDTDELRTVARSCSQEHMRLVLYMESLAEVGGMEYGNQEIDFRFIGGE